MNDHHSWQSLRLMAVIMLFLSVSCKKTDKPGTFTTGYWAVDLTTTNPIPGNNTRNDHAYAVLDLISDSTLHYDIYFGALSSGDAPTTAQIYKGSPAENGSLVLTLTGIGFDAGNSAIGSVTVSQAIADSLTASSSPYYLVVNSTKAPGGLVRGQMGMKIGYALDVSMTGANVKPAVTTSAAGTSFIRLITDNVTLYYNVQVTGIPSGDSLTSAALRKVADSTVVLQLASVPSDFNKSMLMTISTTAATSLKSDSLFIDVRSKLYPKGLISGRIR